jgi:hypothetical protein
MGGRVRSSSSPHWAEGAGQASWGWQERSSGQSGRSRALPSNYQDLGGFPNITTIYADGRKCTLSRHIRSVHPRSGIYYVDSPAYGATRYEVASSTATFTFVQAWGNGVGVGVPQTSDRACCPRAGTPPQAPGFNFNSTSDRRSLTMHAGHSAASMAHWSRRSENAFPTNCSANPADPCCARCWARYGQPSPERYQSYDVGGAHLGVDPANVHLPAGSPFDSD